MSESAILTFNSDRSFSFSFLAATLSKFALCFVSLLYFQQWTHAGTPSNKNLTTVNTLGKNVKNKPIFLDKNVLPLQAYTKENISPLNHSLQPKGRLIEPTSPILGFRFSDTIREDASDPLEILEKIKLAYPNWDEDTLKSFIIFSETVRIAIKPYCQGVKPLPTNNTFTEVEQAAIPLETVERLQRLYLKNYSRIMTGDFETPYEKKMFSTPIEQGKSIKERLNKKAKLLAKGLPLWKQNCAEVDDFRKKAQIVTNVCTLWGLSGCVELAYLNENIFSPETGFPREQFPLNGFTTYVFNEIQNFSDKKLDRMLETLYQAQKQWVLNKRNKKPTLDFGTTSLNALVDAGFSPRDSLILLAYSTRNMPSIDSTYGLSPERALKLEVYFWKFHDFRDYVKSNHLSEVFPNHVFSKDPGLYHYYTAALQSCEITRAGYPTSIAILSAIAAKGGYKIQKLFNEVSPNDFTSLSGLKRMQETATSHGFGTGIEAGQHGGRLGVQLCKP